MSILKRIGFSLVAMVILGMNFVTPVFALKEKTWDKFDLNYIYYYDPDGEVCTPSTGSVNSNDVFIIGDSITVGSENEIKSKLSEATIDAKVSRQFSAGLEILKTDNKDKKVVVMALGSNGTISTNDLNSAINETKDRTLILVTNYKLNDDNAYKSNNALIKNAARENKNVKVADWANAVKDNPSKYITNADGLGVHPTTDGTKLFAETIANAVGNVSTNSSVGTGNKLYNGDPVLSEEKQKKIEENKPFYEKAANKYGLSWQLLATLHYREAGLIRYNPSNGQGAYQLYSYTGGGKNENAFLPAGKISDEEFQRQTDIVAKLISTSYASGLNLDTDDGVKTFFFRYNGTASSYIAQARDLGFSETEANRGEGSPYVMNLADEKRDSRKNPNWKQITTDGGPMSDPANLQPGAFIIYAALGGSSGYSSCAYNGAGNGDLNQTAINLAWPEHGHGLTPRDTYKTAITEVGLSTYGDRYVRIGASCDAFVTTVFRYSGVDPDFKCCGVSHQSATGQYVRTSGKFVEVPNKAGSLKPGDIRLSEGHIEMYVEVDGVGKIASASHGDRTGEIGPFYDNSATFKAYRWKGN